MKMKKRIFEFIAIFILVFGTACAAFGTTYSFSCNAGCEGNLSGFGGGYVSNTDGVTSLEVGCAIQYIYIGPDGEVDPPAQDGGVSGDDKLIKTTGVGTDGAWSIFGDPPVPGLFYYGVSGTAEVSEVKLYVRAWNASNVGVDGSYYGTSEVFTTTGFLLPQPPTDNFGLASFHVVTLFDYSPPLVTVEAPNGGEEWGAESHDIIWTATDESDIKVNSINIYFSTDSGSSYDFVIASSEADDGIYSWTVPSIYSTSCRIKITARDLNDNLGTDESDADFSIDGIAPVATLESPSGGEVWGEGTTHNILWTASDVGGGLTAEPISIYYSTDGGATYPYTVTTEVSNSGSYPWTIPGIDSTTVRVLIEALDTFGNVGSDESSSNFTITSTSPTVESITLRDRTSGSTIYTNEREISLEAVVFGAASDMLISEEGYSGTWQTLENPTEFTLSSGDGFKIVYYRVRGDLLLESNVTSETITLDMTPPGVISIEVSDRTGDGVIYTNDTTVSIEAFGVSAEASQMMISEDPGFSGASWASYLNPTEFTLSSGDGTKTIYYKVRDPASNESTPRSDSIILDTTGPVGTVEVNAGAPATNEVNVTLTLQATDEWLPIMMKVSDDPNFIGVLWESFSETKPWTLTGGQGSKTVYVKFMDGGSNESIIVQDDIVYDTSSPEVTSFTLRDRTSHDTEYTNELTVEVVTTVSDLYSYVCKMQISEEATFVGVPKTPYCCSAEYTICPICDGTKEVFLRVCDVAGNVSSSISNTIILDTVPPSVEAVSPLPGATGESIAQAIYTYFSDNLRSATIIPANFKVWGSSSGSHITSPLYNDSLKRVTFFVPTEDFDYDETIICTIEGGVEDKAENPLISSFTWSFKIKSEPDTAAPEIVDFMIDGEMPEPGDIISAAPMITARIWDMPGASPENISRIELDINAQTVFTWIGGAQHFNVFTGDFDYSGSLSDGVYVITLRAYDLPPSENSTEESFSGLKVFTQVGLEDRPLNYPNPFSPLSGEKTCFGYTLLAPGPTTLDFIIFDITGSAIWRKRVNNVDIGLHKYQQYSYDCWDGKNALGSYVGNGIYILKIVHQGKALGTCKITVLDRR